MSLATTTQLYECGSTNRLSTAQLFLNDQILHHTIGRTHNSRKINGQGRDGPIQEHIRSSIFLYPSSTKTGHGNPAGLKSAVKRAESVLIIQIRAHRSATAAISLLCSPIVPPLYDLTLNNICQQNQFFNNRPSDPNYRRKKNMHVSSITKVNCLHVAISPKVSHCFVAGLQRINLFLHFSPILDANIQQRQQAM